jgi:hypothetical protein
MAPETSRGSSMPNDGQNNAHPSPTEALKVRWRSWPRFDGCASMALSNRRQTSLNQLSEGTRHEHLSD